MLKALLRAAVVLRLESRDLHLDSDLLLNWLRRPAIHLTLEYLERSRRAAARRVEAVIHRLDEVYPF